MRKPPPRSLSEATIRLKQANDALRAYLETTPPPRKSVPPSPWTKAVEELHKPQPVKR